jgi:hypothetical protein
MILTTFEKSKYREHVTSGWRNECTGILIKNVNKLLVDEQLEAITINLSVIMKNVNSIFLLFLFVDERAQREDRRDTPSTRTRIKIVL